MALNTAYIQEAKAKREALMKKNAQVAPSLVQQASVNRAAIMSGQMTPQQQLANRENFAKNALNSSTTINRFIPTTQPQIQAQQSLNTKYNLPANTGLTTSAPKNNVPAVTRATVLTSQPPAPLGNKWINTSTQAGKKQLQQAIVANTPTSAATSGKAFNNVNSQNQIQQGTANDLLNKAQVYDYDTSTYQAPGQMGSYPYQKPGESYEDYVKRGIIETGDPEFSRYASNSDNTAQGQYTDVVNQTSQVYSDAQKEQIQAAQDRIAQLEAMKGTVLDPLTEQANMQKEQLRARAAQQLLEAQQQSAAAKEDQANRFAFTGFGRSSEHADAQAVLATKAMNIESEINRAALLEESRIDAELRGASEGELKGINDQIAAQQDKISGLKSDYATKQGELRLKAIETGQTLSAQKQAALKEQAKLDEEKRKSSAENVRYLMEQAGSGFLQNMSDDELAGVADTMGVPVSALKQLGPTFKQQQQDWDKLKYSNDFNWEQEKFYQGQNFDLQKLAQQQGFDWQKMQASQDFDVQKMLLGDKIDAEKAAREYRLKAGAASYGTYQANANQSNGNYFGYQTPVPHTSANTTVVASNPKLAQAYPDGYKFKAANGSLSGQCAYFAEQLTNLAGKNWAIGNTLQEKKNNLAVKVKSGNAFYPGQENIQVGQTILTTDSKQYGHAAVVNAITPDGKLVLTESNYAGPLQVSNTRTVSPNDPKIFGVLKTEPKPAFKVDKIVGGAVGGAIKGAQTGYKGGSATGVLGGMIGALGGAIGGMYSKPQEISRVDMLETPQFQEEQFAPERQAIRSGATTLPADRVSLLQEFNPQGYQQYMEDLNYSKQGGNTKLPANQVVMLEDAKFLPTVLDKLEQTVLNPNVSFDPVQGTLRSLNPYDTTQKTAEAELRTAAQLIGKFMEGGVLRLEDEVKYRNMLPNAGDNREVAMNKLTQVRQMLQNKMSGYVQGFGGQGYNVSSYQNNLFPAQVPQQPIYQNSTDSLGLGI